VLLNNYEFFETKIENNIAYIYLNKPEKRNAMDWTFWRDLPLLIHDIEKVKDVRVMIIAAHGKSFSTGLDLQQFFTEFTDIFTGSVGEERDRLYHLILDMQKGINAIYDSPIPSIACIQKHCIGGALDLISACDLRYSTKDASISLREVKVGIVADMGSLQRLPSLIGEAKTRELALTGKDVSGEEAKSMGLINEIFDNYEDMIQHAKSIATEIASNPGFVVRGVKQVLRADVSKRLEANLNLVAIWNAAFMDSKDFREAISSFKNKKKPIFNQG
jgi:enoyl-CoA hydratase